jgi:Na+/proline symporter
MASMIVGSASALIWSALKNPYGIHGYFVGTILGLLTIVVVSLLTNEKTPAKKKKR